LAADGLAPEVSRPLLESLGFVPLAEGGRLALDEVVEHRARIADGEPLRVYFVHPDPKGREQRLRWLSIHIDEARTPSFATPWPHAVVLTAHSDRDPQGEREVFELGHEPGFDWSGGGVGIDARRLQLIRQAEDRWQLRLFLCVDGDDSAAGEECWDRIMEHDLDASALPDAPAAWPTRRTDALVYGALVYGPLLPLGIALAAWLLLFGMAVRRSPQRHAALLARLSLLRPRSANSAVFLTFWLLVGAVVHSLWQWQWVDAGDQGLGLLFEMYGWDLLITGRADGGPTYVEWVRSLFTQDAIPGKATGYLFAVGWCAAFFAAYTWVIGARHRDRRLRRLLVAAGGSLALMVLLRLMIWSEPMGSLLTQGYPAQPRPPFGEGFVRVVLSQTGIHWIVGFATAAVCLLCARFGGEPLAEVPEPEGRRLGDLPAILDALPALDEAEAEAFERDLDAAREEQAQAPQADPRES
jgi:hypothetical protein